MNASSWVGSLARDALATWAEGDRVFHRTWRVIDGARTPVLALLTASPHPTQASLDRLAHEFGMKADLDGAWALRPLEFIRDTRRAVLVFEDPGGEPLDRLLGVPLKPGAFLHLAIGIATALGQAHQRGLIHKDIKPSNIFVNRMTAQAWLTGFGIASRLPRERQAPEPPEFIAGTLAYMPPEQTGRMNRSIDSRSDLYSLGATMYEMLTGCLPFSARDPMEWVHCHIARQPAPPADRAKDVPATISAIVMKLLSKTAEDRYQTVEGLLFDLRRCLTEWQAAGSISRFQLGSHDTTQQLLIPEKLYGRDAEIRTLLDAFERVVAQGEPELVLVSGYSGIGKSSVVNELHKVIVLPRGIFISGKFDLRLRDIPCATLAQAFQSLVQQILNSEDARIAHWRNAIQQAVGTHGCLLTDLIPDLESLIGPQLPVPVLSPLETQLRFQSVFQNFVGVFARAEHPLVIFVDDLQWLDPATLTVVENLITHPDTHHLLLIGAYRDNEVGPDHPLVGTLSAIRRANTAVHEIVLSALPVDDFSELLCDALRTPRANVEPLAALIHSKAGGNPFFAGQFLTNLVEEGLLRFEPTSGRWRWDPADIDAKGFTDNVVDLMVRRLQRLPPAAQEALKVLACLGSQAAFGTLTRLWGGSEARMHADFVDALRAGAILSTERSFRFLHDRVQEAAYVLIAPQDRAGHHLRVGRLLLSTMSDDEIAQRIFDVVNQLNLGAPLIADRREQQLAAELNLQAARKAKASTAYSSARSYLGAAVAMLGEAGWCDGYPLAFGVWFELAECAFLDSDFGEAARWIDELSIRVQSKIDRAETFRLRMVLQLVHGENAQAVRTALECLEIFGIELQERPTAEQVRSEYDAMWVRLGQRGIASLVDLPAMENPEMRAVMKVLSTLWRSAYFTDSNLCQTIACRMVSVTQQYGTTESAVIGYALLAIFLGPHFGRYADGETFARLSVAVAEQHGFVAQRVGANFLMQMALLWTQPIERALTCLDAAIASAQETGEIVYACYSLEHRLTDLLARGDHLDELWLESVKALEFVERIRFRHVRDILASIQLFVQRLRGHDNDPPADEEGAVEARLLDAGIAVVVCFYWILQLQRHYLLGNRDAALDCAAKARPLLWSARCHIQYANYCFYESLALAAIHGEAPNGRCDEIRAEIAGHVEALQRWAYSCPVTFAHKHLIVSAELDRINGLETQALRRYEEAARLAHENGFVQEQALANELAAQCCLQGGLERAAQAYLREARDSYYRWGALGKVAQLDELYPSNKPPETSSVLSDTIEEAAGRLDIATIVRTSQAISGEMVLANLIKSLMVIACENAGAQRGLLILPRGAGQRIEAEATVEGRNVVVALPQRGVTSAALPASVLHCVATTRESVILDDACFGNRFAADPYIRERRVRSMLCLPLLKQARLIGVLYLENNLAPSVFVPASIAVLKLLASQAAIALENALLYQELAGREARIRRLVDANIIGIIVWRADGSILEANDAFLRIVGYEREDMLSGRIRWTDLTPPEWRERTDLATEEARRIGYVPPEEKAYLRKDGSRVPVMIGRAAFEPGGDEGVAFVLDLTDRKEGEQRVRESYEMLRELTSRRETAREEERKRIARELHDELGQYLTALRMRASTLRMRFGNDNPALHDETRALISMVDDTMHVVRGVITSLRPPALDTGIVAALEWLSSEFNRNSATVCRLCVQDENLRLNEERAIVLFRLVQEALTNVARHAMATEVIVSLESTPETCMLEVRDNGQGFDAQAIRRTSFGLAGMEERVLMLGGRIEINSLPGRGTTIKVRLPALCADG